MNLIELKCPNCGSVLNVNDELDVFYCNSCGVRIINEKNEKIVTVNINKNTKVETVNKTIDEAAIRKAEIDLIHAREERANDWKLTIFYLSIIFGIIAFLFFISWLEWH